MAGSTTSGIDVDELSDEVRPQDDLFRHVNGRWLATTEIPPDRAAHGAFHMLHDQSELDVRALAEEAAASDAPAGSDERKVGDLWAAFMDVDAVEALDAEPLADDLAAIRAVDSPAELVALLGRLQRHGTSGVIEWFVDNDGDDATRYIVNLVQAGLGLPDEAYYREDAYAEIRAAYVEHVATMLRLVGEPDADAKADRVMALETALAEGHWTTVDSRDALKTHNKRTLDALRALAPGYGWDAWLDALGAPDGAFAEVVVRQPSAVETAARLLGELPLDDWKAWLAFHHVHAAAPYLSSRFVDANFAFYGTLLSGIPELRERWKRGVAVVEGGARRGGRPALRGPPLPARAQGPHGPPGRLAGRGLPRRHRGARVDVARDPPAGARQARQVHAQGRLPRPLARLLVARHRPRRPARQRAAGRRLRGRPQPAQDRLPDRPRRVAHDPADGQRLLQPRHERDRLPGGDPALAVLRPRGRRRHELRRHRRGHRARDRPRVRRPGQPLRRRRQPRRLVDRGRPRRLRRADQGAGRRSTTGSRPRASTATT